jgi:hypothetical protein
MRRFEDISADQILDKIKAMRSTEHGDILREWLTRYREGCRSELETAFENQVAITFNQGRIDLAKELLTLLDPEQVVQPKQAATPSEPARRLPWRM